MRSKHTAPRLVVFALCAAIAAVAGAQEPPPSPFARLYDTAAPSSAPLAADAFAKKAGWKLVPEHNVSHAFAGDAVAVNDKVAVVLRKDAQWAEIRAKTPRGFLLRALLHPAGYRQLVAIKVTENDPSAVMLRADFRADGGGTASLDLRLTAGEMMVETRPGNGATRLLVHSPARYVVVPDYFAQDMVFGPELASGFRTGLPAENIVLNLFEGGDAIVVWVWPSAEQNADLIIGGKGRDRLVVGCLIDCAKGKSIWLACLEGKGLWHAATGAEALADWKPPFPARWRCDLVGEDGLAVSHDLGEEPLPRGHAGPIVVYPLERSRATPLTVFCPIDVLRNALGVGPCQYVLAMEGLGADTPATPAFVTQWVERQFKRRPARRKADEIRERLGQMTYHVASTQARIAGYAAFAQRVRRLGAGLGPHAQTLRRIVDELDSHVAETVQTSRVERLAAELAKLIGQPDAQARVAKLCEQLRAVGAAQNRTLACCRMAVRRLKQLARTAASEPNASDAARQLLTQASDMLRKKGNRP